MGLDSVASLIVASLDLQLVRLLRDAIRTTELSDPGCPCGPGRPSDGARPRPVLAPEPVIEPRRHIHPPPVIEPRDVIHLAPVVLPPDPALCPDLYTEPCPASPIEPPWKVLPWERKDPPPCPPAKVIKLVMRPPDIAHKGTLIDFFI